MNEKQCPEYEKSISGAECRHTGNRKIFGSCLERDKEDGLRKQTYTAKRIYDRRVSEMGFTGSYSIVRCVVHDMRSQYIPAQADMSLEYDPGDAIQIEDLR